LHKILQKQSIVRGWLLEADGINETNWIFYGNNPSGRTMSQGSIQPLTEKSSRNISWG